MRRRSHALLKASLAAALAVAAFVAWIVFEPGGPGAAQAFDDLALVAAPLLAVVACGIAAARSKGPARSGWTLIAASAFSWAAGGAAWAYYELALGVEVPFPSLADVGYLAAVPLAAAGMLVLAGDVADPRPRLRAALDGLVIGISLLFLSWALVLRPVFETAEGGALERVLAFTYPLGDVVVATFAVFLAARAPSGRARPMLLLAASLLAMAVADSGFAYLTATGAYETGHLLDAGWFAGYLALAVAAYAWVLAPTGPPRTLPLPSTASVVLPYAPLAMALGVAGWSDLHGRPLDGFLFWIALGLVFLVLARQLLTLGENVDLLGRLGKANDELRRVEAFRSKLLSNVSHDLGTPLTPILLQLHLLESAPVGDRERRALDVIRRNVGQLQRLVDDVKDVARLQDGWLQLDRQAVDLGELAHGAVDSFRQVAEHNGVRLSVFVHGPLPVRADPQRATQVLFNLLTNALKFTPRGGRVVVTAGTAHGEARVRVDDDGRGLAPDEIRRLFQPFSQVHAPGEIKEKGTGLGLFISRGIMERHEGRLWCESEGLGKGARFILAMPLDSPARGDAPTSGAAPSGPAHAAGAMEGDAASA